MKLLALFAAAGAALAYFLDPRNGKRRRHVAVDRVGGFFRRRGRDVSRTGRAVTSEAYGVAKKATHLREKKKPQPNDATLTSKVESEIFRDADVPKGRISVNAEDGVVYLRGEVESPDLISHLEQAARKVQGVQDVENLLHVPGSPAPRKQ
jgi:osmotically-inducible protein OsmY